MIHKLSKIAIGATVVGALAAGLAYAQSPSTPQRSDNAASSPSELNNNNSRGTGVFNTNNNRATPERADTMGNDANDRDSTLRGTTGNTNRNGMDTDRNTMPRADGMGSNDRSMNNGTRAPRNDRN